MRNNLIINLNGRALIDIDEVVEIIARTVRSEVGKAVADLGVMPNTDQPFLTITETAHRYQVTPKTARSWVKSGKIPALRIGGIIRIDPRKADEALSRFDSHQLSKQED